MEFQKILIRKLRKNIEDKEMKSVTNDVQIIIGELQRMMLVEEMRLLPYALELLAEKDWKEMRIGEEEIGWAFNIKPESSEDFKIASEENPKQNLTKNQSKADADNLFSGEISN